VDNELEVIRDEMEETRASLASKLEALETQVRETVSGASETVTSTVEGVKDVVETVSDTVSSVTETFNISKQVEEHPWAALGIAITAGFVAAQLFGGASPAPVAQPQPQPQPPLPNLEPIPAPAAHTQPATFATPPAQPSQAQSDGIAGMLPSLESLLPDMSGAIQTAITGVSSLAVGTLMGVVREVAVNGLPAEWQQELTRVVDQMTTQLGGKPLQALKKEETPPVQPNPPSQEDRLARLEELPSPLPPHQENVTQPPDWADQRSRRGRNQTGSKV
jgi:ElaB/YqjD/DUF883 family membrane-anchored ribosome-binding protein